MDARVRKGLARTLTGMLAAAVVLPLLVVGSASRADSADVALAPQGIRVKPFTTANGFVVDFDIRSSVASLVPTVCAWTQHEKIVGSTKYARSEAGCDPEFSDYRADGIAWTGTAIGKLRTYTYVEKFVRHGKSWHRTSITQGTSYMNLRLRWRPVGPPKVSVAVPGASFCYWLFLICPPTQPGVHRPMAVDGAVWSPMLGKAARLPNDHRATAWQVSSYGASY